MKEFIEKAIEGGWKYQERLFGDLKFDERIIFNHEPSIALQPFIDSILLDPLAWQAVGKVEGWTDLSKEAQGIIPLNKSQIVWYWNMHRMIDALCEGQTPEEYISTLFKK